jgi:predicted Zn finger-like uncharacterized protein
MEVSCPACAARYTADDSKLRGKTARMRCRACDTVWLVSGPSSASSIAAPPGDLDNTAPRAAIQRRGAEREHRDLFASRPLEDGGVKETLRPPPPFAGTSGVAARNENSVLFKVTDVLGPRGDARVKTPEPSAPAPAFNAPSLNGPGSYAPPARDGRDDSGVIDLKALSTAPPAPHRAPAPMLFGPPPSEAPPAFARDVVASSSYPQQAAAKNNLRSFGMIAAGFAVVAMCGLGVAFAFGGENPPPKAAAAPAPPPPPAPPPVVTPAPAAEPAPAAAAETKDEKKTTSGKKHRGGKGGGKASSGVITSKSPPPPPPAKVKPADPCGCHGDFNCILACTAGKK